MNQTMGINWIGLYTMVRREASRMARIPIQAFVAPWISALLFIFIFGSVRGRPHLPDRRPSLSGIRPAGRADDEHRQCRLPAILLGDLFFPLHQIHGRNAGLAALLCGDDRRQPHAWWCCAPPSPASAFSSWASAFGATHIESWPMFLFWIVSVSTRLRPAGAHHRALVQELRAAQHAGGVSSHPAVHGGRRVQHGRRCCRPSCNGWPMPILSSISSTAFAAP